MVYRRYPPASMFSRASTAGLVGPVRYRPLRVNRCRSRQTCRDLQMPLHPSVVDHGTRPWLRGEHAHGLQQRRVAS